MIVLVRSGAKRSWSLVSGLVVATFVSWLSCFISLQLEEPKKLSTLDKSPPGCLDGVVAPPLLYVCGVYIGSCLASLGIYKSD